MNVKVIVLGDPKLEKDAQAVLDGVADIRRYFQEERKLSPEQSVDVACGFLHAVMVALPPGAQLETAAKMVQVLSNAAARNGGCFCGKCGDKPPGEVRKCDA